MVFKVDTENKKFKKPKNDQFFENLSFSFFERNFESYELILPTQSFQKKFQKLKNEKVERLDRFTFLILRKKLKTDFAANNDLLFETTSVFLILSQFQKLKINADLLNKLFSDFGTTKNTTIDEEIGFT